MQIAPEKQRIASIRSKCISCTWLFFSYANQLNAIPLQNDTLLLPDLSLLFLCLSALHVSTAILFSASQCQRITLLFLCFSKPSHAFSLPCYYRQLYTSAKPNISDAMHIFSIPSLFKADLCRHISIHRSSVSLLNVTLPSPNRTIPSPFTATLFLRVANQCRYLKIVVGLWLISCQTKAPLPEFLHCPNPLNFP